MEKHSLMLGQLLSSNAFGDAKLREALCTRCLEVGCFALVPEHCSGSWSTGKRIGECCLVAGTRSWALMCWDVQCLGLFMQEQSSSSWHGEQCAFLLNLPGSQTLRYNRLIHKLIFYFRSLIIDHRRDSFSQPRTSLGLF